MFSLTYWAQFFDFRVISRTLIATVPTQVLIVTVLIVLAVLKIVFGVVRDEITKRESIMRGDKVNALLGFSIAMPVDIRACEETLDKMPGKSFVTFDKCSDIITKTPIPFFPAISKEVSDLVKAGSVPCLSDQLGSR